MKNRRIVLTFLIVFSLIFSSLGSLLVKPVKAQAETPNLEASQVFVVRVYYTNQEEIQKLIPFDLFEFNDKIEKYVLVAANQSELERI